MRANNLAENLSSLRRAAGLSQEKAAETAGVTRQALAKWESGESVPDALRCGALAELYGVSVDDLLHFDQKGAGMPVPPRGKYVFGVVQMGERGQIVIPKRARDVLELKKGDALVVLGDTNPGTAGLALTKAEPFAGMLAFASQMLESGKEEDE